MRSFFTFITFISTASLVAAAEVNFNLFKGQGIEAATGILNTVINWLYTILLILAVIFVLVAAFNYLTANGDDDKIIKAKHILIYAAVALGVAFLASGFIFVVEELVGVRSTSSTLPPELDPNQQEYWDARNQSPADGPLNPDDLFR